MQSRYSWKYRRNGYVQFSSKGQNKMSAYWVYDLKSCRSYMIRLTYQHLLLFKFTNQAATGKVTYRHGVKGFKIILEIHPTCAKPLLPT